MVSVIPAGSVMLAVVVEIQPLLVVTVTVQVPTAKLLAVAAVPPLGAHEQVYGVVPPTGVTVADPFVPPKQEIFTSTIESVAAGVTVTVTVAVLIHPDAAVPVTVQVVVAAGLAETVAPVVALKPVAGDQEQVLAPEAVNVPAMPAHIVIGDTEITGSEFTVTITVVVFTHPTADVPVIVQVVVAAGLAETEVPVVALKPVAGAHVQVDAPLAVNVPAIPEQIVIGVQETVGKGFTVTITVAVFTHPATEVPVTV